MHRFVIEHLPRLPAKYDVLPLDFDQAKAWLNSSLAHSLIRTRELTAAIEITMGITLTPSDGSVSLRPGDEALLITLSYSVLLAWTEGKIPPLVEDWRCFLLTVDTPIVPALIPKLEMALPSEPADASAVE